jgi:phage-related baseplate assembly protein
MALTKPEFVDVNPLTILDEIVASYQEKTSKILQPADIERFLFNEMALRESIIRNQINYAAVQNLVDFASAPILDYLAKLVGVIRIPPAAASCQITLSFVGNILDIVIPAGTRIASQDGLLVFALVESVTIPAMTTDVTVTATCLTDGVSGNGYGVGTITEIQDPQPYLTTAVNSDVTAGGAEEESDDQLRVRVKLAPASFSVAGPRDAYKFWALSAHPDIIDVAVPDVVTPGLVTVYPLMENGDPTPTEVLDLVKAVLNLEKIRPLSDTVNALSPTRVDYALTINLTLFSTAIQADVIAQVTTQITDFKDSKRRTLGQDIISTQVIAAIMKDLESQIYKVVLAGFVDIIIAPNEFAFCTGFTINIIGTNNG